MAENATVLRAVIEPFPDLIDRAIDLLGRFGWDYARLQLRDMIDLEPGFDRQRCVRHMVRWLNGEAADSEPLGHRGLMELACWSTLGRAFAALRDKQLVEAHHQLDSAEESATTFNTMLIASIRHCRGVVWHNQARHERANSELFAALELFGPDHFMSGRVLDSLGMSYAAQHSLVTALGFYREALRVKQQFNDDAGLMVTHGQLGRLCLDWGFLDEAETHFLTDLRIAERLENDPGIAQMNNHLGQVRLAQRRPLEALAFLNESVDRSSAMHRTILEAFARKDRALAFIALNRRDEARGDLDRSRDLFESVRFEGGLAYVDRALGQLLRAEGAMEESSYYLRRSADVFERERDPAERARALAELAATQRAAGGSVEDATGILRQALACAEESRRDHLIHWVGDQLREVNEAVWWNWLYLRSRGRSLQSDNQELDHGEQTEGSILFFDVRDYTGFVRSTDPGVVMRTLNQIFADVTPILREQQLQVNQYLGDGFMALAAGHNSAARAVAAGVQVLRAVGEFNRPRRVLRWPILDVRVGVSTGPIHLGNVGTAEKVDFTAVGPHTNLAARLMTEANPGFLCICETTAERVKALFPFTANSPRSTVLKGFGETRIWEIEPK